MTGDPKKAGGSRQEREAEDRELDEALEESFPASDPPSTTGTSAGAPDERHADDKPKGRPRKPRH